MREAFRPRSKVPRRYDVTLQSNSKAEKRDKMRSPILPDDLLVTEVSRPASPHHQEYESATAVSPM